MPNPEQLELFPFHSDTGKTGDATMGKVINQSAKPDFFPKGGTGKMFGKGRAGAVVSGQSGKESNAPSGGGDKWASGGSGKMFDKGHAGKKVPGISGKATQSG